MAKYKIVRIDFNGSRIGLKEELEGLQGLDYEFKGVDAETEDELIEGLKDADVAITSRADFTRRVLENVPKLRGVIRMGVGYDNVDVDAATDNGVLVINNPSPVWCVEEVSNQSILLMLAITRKFVKGHNFVISGEWRSAQAAMLPQECIHGQTMGIIGCGNIGRCVAKKGKAFGMKLVGYDPYVSEEEAQESGITLVSLDELLNISDFVMVQPNLTDETHHILDDEAFSKMKPTAFVINTSRGGCIDEEALIRALEEKKIAGAGLDVLEQEPPRKDNPLLKMDNVLFTPHSASWTTVAFQTLNRSIGYEAADLLNGKRPEYVVNKEAISKFCK